MVIEQYALYYAWFRPVQGAPTYPELYIAASVLQEGRPGEKLYSLFLPASLPGSPKPNYGGFNTLNVAEYHVFSNKAEAEASSFAAFEMWLAAQRAGLNGVAEEFKARMSTR